VGAVDVANQPYGTNASPCDRSRWLDCRASAAPELLERTDVLEQVRQAGLAVEGPAWALRQRELATMVRTLLPTLKREMERNQEVG
jgi:hypothetical protein